MLVKKKGSDDTPHSYRPISLLNFDYKILSRILKARLENVVRDHHILTESQKCANPNRNIFQATLSLKDRVAQLIQRKQRAKLISFDLEQAFDRVRRPYLHRTMCSLGINRRLVDLLSRIATLSSSRLLVNGHLSPSFPIQRSVRQGCPLSMLLFVLYLHPLLTKLEGVSREDLVVAYADDITVISTSTQRIHTMKELIDRFEHVSGARLNLQKTQSIDIGYIGGNPLDIPWLRTTNTIKVLGVIFANSIRLMVTLNWDAMVRKFSQLTWFHSMRSLNLYQKVTLLNTFITAKIWYLASHLCPYAVHTAKLTSTMGSFLWSRMPARVPMIQLARERSQGGLKLQLPAIKCKSLLLNRHLQDLDFLPFYKSIIHSNNQPQTPVPADLPDLKLICQQQRLLPIQIQQNPSSEQICCYFLEQTEAPRVERMHPNTDWKRAWLNASSRRLPSSIRSDLFIIMNEKTEHRQLLHLIRRADGENCTHCGTAVETMEHKFSTCTRVAGAWTLLQHNLTAVLNGWRRLSFNDLLRPVLPNINLTKRIRILKLFSLYISYINKCNNRIDVAALEFHLNCEC